MNKPSNNPLPLDYEPRGARIAGKFRIGVIALALSILPAFIAAIAMLEFDHHSISSTVYSTFLGRAMTLSCIGLSVGVVGLFQRNGRRAAIAGMVICFLETIVIPALQVAT